MCLNSRCLTYRMNEHFHPQMVKSELRKATHTAPTASELVLTIDRMFRSEHAYSVSGKKLSLRFGVRYQKLSASP